MGKSIFVFVVTICIVFPASAIAQQVEAASFASGPNGLLTVAVFMAFLAAFIYILRVKHEANETKKSNKTSHKPAKRRR